MAGLQHLGYLCLLTCGGAVLMAPTTGLANPTEIPQVRVPGRPHRYPTFQELCHLESTNLEKAPTAQLTRIDAADRLFSVL